MNMKLNIRIYCIEQLDFIPNQCIATLNDEWDIIIYRWLQRESHWQLSHEQEAIRAHGGFKIKDNFLVALGGCGTLQVWFISESLSLDLVRVIATPAGQLVEVSPFNQILIFHHGFENIRRCFLIFNLQALVDGDSDDECLLRQDTLSCLKQVKTISYNRLLLLDIQNEKQPRHEFWNF